MPPYNRDDEPVPVTLHHGDCLEVLRTLPDDSVHSVVTDPPYGLSISGQHWDRAVPPAAVWSEVLRALRPGGHLLSFAGTRTYHRLAVAIEDGGFEIRDQIGWLHGSGWPKSRNLDGEWSGWGTALKPAWEPICVARKPPVGTVAANMQAHGTGALNIDGSRVEHVTVAGGNLALNPHLRSHINGGNGGRVLAHEAGRRVVRPHPSGRWPSNVAHDGSDEVMRAFAASGGGAPDMGTAARFHYCAKASEADRAGSRHVAVKPVAPMRWLVRLVTSEGGVVLDPFAGSGTTGQAAVEEGFDAILIEREAEYCDDIRRRLAASLSG